MPKNCFHLLSFVIFGSALLNLFAAEPDRPDFDKDVLPLLKKNCLACHSSNKAKADLVLETPALMRKGGESGPAIVPGKSDESLLIKSVTGKTETPMPPKKNKVDAKELKSEEIALLKRWIDSGANASGLASGSGAGTGAGPVVWRPLPTSLSPIYATAVTNNGQYSACSRANQIFVYHLPSGQQSGLLGDPALGGGENPIADRDMVEALTFSPDGTLLASGGYRSVKLWRRQPWASEAKIEVGPLFALTVSPDGKRIATGTASGIRIWSPSGAMQKEITGHSGDVKALKFSPDGMLLCSGGADKTLRVWKVEGGEEVTKAETPAVVLSVAWLGDGKRVVSGGADNVIRVWQLPDSSGPLTMAKEIKGHSGPVNALETLLPDGKQIVSGSADGSVQIWDPESGASVRKMNHGGSILSVAVRKDGKRFASASTDKTVKLWNNEGKEVATLKGDRRAQEAADEVERTLGYIKEEVAFHKTSLQNAEKQQKAEAEAFKKATDARTSAETASKQKKEAAVKAVAERDAGAKANAEPIAALKKGLEEKEKNEKANVQAQNDLKTARDKAAAAVKALTQATEAKQAAEKAVAGLGSKAKPNDVKAAKDKLAAAQAALTQVEAGKTAAEKAVAELESKAKAADDARNAAGTAYGQLQEKHKDVDGKVKTLEKAAADAEKAAKDAEHSLSVADQSLARAQEQIKRADQVFAAAKAESERFEAQLKQAEAAFEAAKKTVADSEKPVASVAFSPNNQLLASGGEDNLIHTWNAETGAAGEVIAGHSANVSALVFLSDNRPVSGGADPFSFVWRSGPEWKLERTLGTGDEKSPFSDRVLALDFTADGKWLATGGGIPARAGEVKIFEASSGTLVRELKEPHSDAVFGLSFAADGKKLATCGADKFIKLWDTATGKQVKSLEGHTHHVLSVSWKRDGRTVVSCGADKTVKVWDLVTGEQKKTMEGYKKEVTTVHYIDNKNEILVAAGDSKVRVVKEDGNQVRDFKTGGEYIQSAAVTPDGKTVVAGGQDGVLRVFDGANSKALRTFESPNAPKTEEKKEEAPKEKEKGKSEKKK
jgi:WD40 repeat protein